MSVGFGVSLVAEGEAIDPAGLLLAVAPSLESRNIEVYRSGNVLWFIGPQRSSLIELAAPLAGWWQETVRSSDHQVDFRFVGPNGVDITSYCRPDVAPALVQSMIEHDSGTPSLPDAVGIRRVL
ncbi:hypothetical protein [Micromonospora fulviviridis]|uniref:hypothetical protein n=1 Tax=Micromonospora fulviviridis TaxID=47860 RepID=UPI001668CAA7|nr:hypothetical protein [Micromonospora fulviviridis]